MLFTKESKIKDVLVNPVGADLIDYLFKQLGYSTRQKKLFKPIMGHVKLKYLPLLLRDYIDEELIESLCNIMNHYRNEVLPQDRLRIKEAWWKEAVCYQIYPRSFYDSNHDGIGDLQGIIKKLDYLRQLGINLIWLSPIYDSPNDDNGYDIRNYFKIMEEFGTMEDFTMLLKEAHRRGIRIIMDLVINHTSDEHPWFKMAKEDKKSPYRDYYFWKEGKGKEPPNNWKSIFKGEAWEYDEKSNQYYLHTFSKKQVDLNWENKDLRQDIYKMVNWWLKKGIDGFRLDVINFISKEKGLPDGNKKLGELSHICGIEHYMFGPKVHDYLRELHYATFANFDVVTVGECLGIGIQLSKYFTHEKRKELNMTFNFDHLDQPGKSKWDIYDYDLNYLKDSLTRLQLETGDSSWNSLFIENHDAPRMISRVTRNPEEGEAIAKLLAVIMLTLKGTPFIYQGQEIGMMNTGFTDIEEIRDVESLNAFNALKEGNYKDEEIMDYLSHGSRDNARVPLSWNEEMYGGFSTVQPWIKNSQDYKDVNVEKQRKDEGSVFWMYKTLISLRKQFPVLIYGDFLPLSEKVKDVFAYERVNLEKTIRIVINLSSKKKKISIEGNVEDLLLTTAQAMWKNNKIYEPYEARVFKVN